MVGTLYLLLTDRQSSMSESTNLCDQIWENDFELCQPGRYIPQLIVHNIVS